MSKKKSTPTHDDESSRSRWYRLTRNGIWALVKFLNDSDFEIPENFKQIALTSNWIESAYIQESAITERVLTLYAFYSKFTSVTIFPGALYLVDTSSADEVAIGTFTCYVDVEKRAYLFSSKEDCINHFIKIHEMIDNYRKLVKI